MSFNMIGLIIAILIYFPKIIRAIYEKRSIHLNRYKQLAIIEIISGLGCVFFGMVTIGYGYQFKNQIIEIVYICVSAFLFIAYYFCYFRWLFNKKKGEYLYNKLLFIPVPIAVFESLIFVFSGFILFNPYVIFFGIIYSTVHVFLDYKKSKGVF